MNEINLNYRLNKRAKRISIKLNELGDVIVNIPKESLRLKAEKFVEENLTWIKSKVKDARSRANISNQFKLKIESGEKIILFDDSVYELELRRGGKNYYIVDEEAEKIFLYANHSITNELELNLAYVMLLKKFYKETAKEIFAERTKFYADKLNVEFNKITIKDQSSRWGSCSSDKNLNYNFRVLLAPERVLDYLVIHEVCHLIEMNHSKKFWDLVQNLMPDYRDAKKWLSDNGFLLKYYLK